MKLPVTAQISRKKLTQYLLVSRKRSDKSKWLEQAGYTAENWHELEHDLRIQILSADANPIETTLYGQLYEIRGTLKGPKGKIIHVCTIWMVEKEGGLIKFITMYPDKRKSLR